MLPQRGLNSAIIIGNGRILREKNESAWRQANRR
jgi:hypothetical protein